MPHDPALDRILAAQWQALADAVRDPDHDWHWPVLATHGDDGPDARTVVLRACDPSQRALQVHSAAGTGKLAQLQALPRACLVFNDRIRRMQLRIYASVQQFPRDEAAWQSLGTGSRALYRRGRDDFVRLQFTVQALDWLDLSQPEHRRARFDWAGDGEVRAGWIAP